MDYTSPLNSHQIETLLSLGVQFWTNRDTKETFILKRYWNGATPEKRDEITAALSTIESPKHLREKGQEFACSDMGNKDRFVKQYGDTLAYLNEEQRWLIWDEEWRPADKFALAGQVVRNIYNEAAACDNHQGRHELAQWAARSESLAYQKSMLTLASEALGISVSEFDVAPTSLNCVNGVVDLETNRLIPHSPDQRHLKRTTVAYDRNAACPRWLQFLAEVFQGDRELIAWIQQALGYSLTGLTDEHVFFLLYGQGRNGKGVFAETILEILGSYAAPTQFEVFLASDKSGVRVQEAIGRLRGIRFAVASETSDGRRFSEALIKQLTGGDTLVGTKLRGDSYTFKPTHKLWFACNHRPAIKDATVGMWERVKVVPFMKTFSEEEQDKRLKQALRGEKAGIFAWLVDGARQYLQSGRLPPAPQASQEAVRTYRDDNDTLSVFIREKLDKDGAAKIGVKEVYDQYTAWCLDRNETPISLNYFPRNMEERGILKRKTEKGMVFQGYKLNQVDNRGLVASAAPPF